MDIGEQMRDPLGAAMVAACITAGYIHLKVKLNNEDAPPTSAYVKPALLNAFLVYFIVSSGIAAKERISTDPF